MLVHGQVSFTLLPLGDIIVLILTKFGNNSFSVGVMFTKATASFLLYCLLLCSRIVRLDHFQTVFGALLIICIVCHVNSKWYNYIPSSSQNSRCTFRRNLLFVIHATFS